MRQPLFVNLTISALFFSASAWAQTNSCDLVSPTGTVDATDVQAAINMSLGVSTCPSSLNIVGAGLCNVVMVQRVINAALGGRCINTSHGVTLTWVASPTSGVTGYYIYRSTSASGPYTKLNPTVWTSLTYDDTAVQAGQTYYYVVTAFNGSAESGYSTQVQAKTPNP